MTLASAHRCKHQTAAPAGSRTRCQPVPTSQLPPASSSGSGGSGVTAHGPVSAAAAELSQQPVLRSSSSSWSDHHRSCSTWSAWAQLRQGPASSSSSPWRWKGSRFSASWTFRPPTAAASVTAAALSTARRHRRRQGPTSSVSSRRRRQGTLYGAIGCVPASKSGGTVHGPMSVAAAAGPSPYCSFSSRRWRLFQRPPFIPGLTPRYCNFLHV